jgi:hypothetical protein
VKIANDRGEKADERFIRMATEVEESNFEIPVVFGNLD